MCAETEACDGEDGDCDPSTIEGTDADDDGYCAEDGESLPCCPSGGGDCDDEDETVHPGAAGELGCASDEDGDGHNAPGDVTGGRPDDDCCDDDVDAFPGQKAWFTADDDETNCGGWDYDCSGVTELEVGADSFCSCMTTCNGTDGWDGPVPACGDSGNYSTCGGAACGDCPAETAARQQGCH